MSRKKIERGAQRRKPRSRVGKRLFLLPLIAVCVWFVYFGWSELVPETGLFGIVWTVAASLTAAGLAAGMVWKKEPPQRLFDYDDEDEEPPEEPEEPEEPETSGEAVLIDEVVSHQVYRRAKQAADAAAKEHAHEELKQLRALRELGSLSEEEYETRRRELWKEL